MWQHLTTNIKIFTYISNIIPGNKKKKKLKTDVFLAEGYLIIVKLLY